MPAPPEVLNARCQIGLAEVVPQPEAKQPGNGDGHIAVAGEVGVDLHGVGQGVHHQHQAVIVVVLYEQLPRHDGQPVGDHQLQKRAPQEAQQKEAEILIPQRPLSPDLGQQLPPLLDGAGDHRGEEADEQGVTDHIPLRLQLPVVHIEQIGTALKYIEAETHRQQDGRQGEAQGCPQPPQQEAGVLEHQQHQQQKHRRRDAAALVPAAQPPAQITQAGAQQQKQHIFIIVACVKHKACQQQDQILPPCRPRHGVDGKAQRQKQRPELEVHK